MMTPQLTEQYGQVLRVSLVREILRVFACARMGAVSKPNAVSAVPPATADWMNARRDISMSPLQLMLPAFRVNRGTKARYRFATQLPAGRRRYGDRVRM